MDLKKLLYRKLNREQRAAAAHLGGEVRCLAAPGAGILPAMAWRILLLAAGDGGARGLCALTFSEKRARTLRREIFQVAATAGAPSALLSGIHVGTVTDYAFAALTELAGEHPPLGLLDPWLFRLYLACQDKDLGFREVRRENLTSLIHTSEGMAAAWKTANDELLDVDSLPGRPGPVKAALRNISAALDKDRLLDGSLAVSRLVRILESMAARDAQELEEAQAAAASPAARAPKAARPSAASQGHETPGPYPASPAPGRERAAAAAGSGGPEKTGQGQEGYRPGADELRNGPEESPPVPEASSRPQCQAILRALGLEPGFGAGPGPGNGPGDGLGPDPAGKAEDAAFQDAGPWPSGSRDGIAGAALTWRNGKHMTREKDGFRLATVPFPPRHLLAEGFQDATMAQARLLALLGDRAESVFLAGDDDRAIEPGRGVGARDAPPFWGKQATEIVILGSVSRAAEDVARAATGFVEQSLPGRRHPKAISAPPSDLPQDVRTFLFPDRRSEARWIAGRIQALLGTAYPEGKSSRGLTPGDFAISLRSPLLGELDRQPRHAAFARELKAKGIPYRLCGGFNPFDLPETRAILGALSLLQGRSLETSAVTSFFEKSVRPAFRNANFSRFEAVIARAHRAVHRVAPGDPPLEALRIIYSLLEVIRAFKAADRIPFLERLGHISRMAAGSDRLAVGRSPQGFRKFLALLAHFSLDPLDEFLPSGGAPPDAVEITDAAGLKEDFRPCVFLPDVEQLRFPARRSGYDGLLPREALATAFKRGAYRVTVHKEARLFYTALTAAGRYLYVTGAERLPRARRPAFRSEFLSRVRNVAEWDGRKQDPERLPSGLVPAPPARPLPEEARPRAFAEILSYLHCPKSYELMMLRGLVPEPQEAAFPGKPSLPRRGRPPKIKPFAAGLLEMPGPAGSGPDGSGASTAQAASGGLDAFAPGPGAAGDSGSADKSPLPENALEGAAAEAAPCPPLFYAPCRGEVIAGRVRPASPADGSRGDSAGSLAEIPGGLPGRLEFLADSSCEGSPAFPADSMAAGILAACFRAQVYLAYNRSDSAPETATLTGDVLEEGALAENVPEEGALTEGVPEEGAFTEGVPEEGALTEDFPEEPSLTQDFPKEDSLTESLPNPLPGAGGRNSAATTCANGKDAAAGRIAVPGAQNPVSAASNGENRSSAAGEGKNHGPAVDGEQNHGPATADGKPGGRGDAPAASSRPAEDEADLQACVTLLPQGQVQKFPAGPSALKAALANLDWAVKGALAQDFPMRPHPYKCHACGFRKICRKTPEPFAMKDAPPALELPGGPCDAGAFSLFEEEAP
ncbi:MAG: ATP-dependent helicase [Deltaproteobacteria bacterium]|jgi:superfamily I DNA/RNA helicase|nr:ATP-dependent helicase [Deltaproteobacteria bacterium]